MHFFFSGLTRVNQKSWKNCPKKEFIHSTANPGPEKIPKSGSGQVSPNMLPRPTHRVLTWPSLITGGYYFLRLSRTLASIFLPSDLLWSYTSSIRYLDTNEKKIISTLEQASILLSSYIWGNSRGYFKQNRKDPLSWTNLDQWSYFPIILIPVEKYIYQLLTYLPTYSFQGNQSMK